jgi:hypothetical protein
MRSERAGFAALAKPYRVLFVPQSVLFVPQSRADAPHPVPFAAETRRTLCHNGRPVPSPRTVGRRSRPVAWCGSASDGAGA